MKYVIRERFFYYDDEYRRCNHHDLGYVNRKVFDDKQEAMQVLLQMQIDHFLSKDWYQYNGIPENNEEFFNQLGLEYKFNQEGFESLKDIANMDYEAQKRLYNIMIEWEVHRYELVALSDSKMTIFYVPQIKEYATIETEWFDCGTSYSKEEKFLVYEDEFQANKNALIMMLDTRNVTNLSGSVIFQSVLKQYDKYFKLEIKNDEQWLQTTDTPSVIPKDAINAMNAIIDPPWFIPKQVTIEEFLKIQNKMDDEYDSQSFEQKFRDYEEE